MASTPKSNPQSVFDFTVNDAKGNDVDLSVYNGKVLLIINVASKCGMTNSNYAELNYLYEKYKDQVNGSNAAPLYKFLKSGKWGIFGDGIQWNFAKFLVDKDGQVADRYLPHNLPSNYRERYRKAIGNRMRIYFYARLHGTKPK